MLGLNQADPSQTIILAGSGRSGTTWLGNIIAANPNVGIIFEPFDYRHVPEASILPLRPYARPGDMYPEWGTLFQKILCGHIQNQWTRRQGHRWWAWKRLIKAIRINLMLAWIDDTFHPKIVFTTRHPCAVVLSRLKLKWDTHLDVFLAQPALVSDYLQPYVDLIEQAKTPVQQHTIMWCIENLVPLRQLPQRNWIFCTYEQLVQQPEQEAARVLEGLGIRKTWFTQRAIKKISMVARPGSALLRDKDPLTAWKSQLTTEEIDTILNITCGFGLTIYTDNALPNPKNPKVNS